MLKLPCNGSDSPRPSVESASISVTIDLSLQTLLARASYAVSEVRDIPHERARLACAQAPDAARFREVPSVLLVAFGALSVALGACNRPPPEAGQGGTLNVRVSAGAAVAGATVTISAVDDSGSIVTGVGHAGVLAASGPTDATGAVTLTLSSGYRGLVQVVASGQGIQYVDPSWSTPATNISIPSDFALSSYVLYDGGSVMTVPVTLWTTLADHEALAVAKGLHPSHPTPERLSHVVSERDPLFVEHIVKAANTWTPTALRTTVPVLLTSGPQTLSDIVYAELADAALNMLAHDIAQQAGYDRGSSVINAITLVQLLEQDLDADGVFDGKGARGVQLRTTGSSPVSIDAQTLRLPFATALDEFIFTPSVNKTGITRVDLRNAGVYDAITNDNSDLFGAAPNGSFVFQRIPPSVAFATAIPTATNAPLTVQVTASDTGAGVATVWVQLNGTQPVQATATSTPGLYQTLPLTLRAGPNTVVAWAVDNAQTSGEGKPNPATATATVIFDNMKPDPSFVPTFASYYDERGLTVATSGKLAVVPAQYNCSTAVNGCNKALISLNTSHDIYKVATRLGWSTQPTAAVLESSNPDNIPVLQGSMPYSPASDAPIASARYSVAISCTGCSYAPVTGDLWPSAVASSSALYFDLPVASNLIPALASLSGPATLTVSVTFTDAAGNANAAGPAAVSFHLLGPPLAVVPDDSYTNGSSSDVAHYSVSNSNYPDLWGKQGLVLRHYTVSNPYAQPVAITYPQGTWTNKESWKAHRQMGSTWLTQSGCNASPGYCSEVTSFYGSAIWQWPSCANGRYGCGDNCGGSSKTLMASWAYSTAGRCSSPRVPDACVNCSDGNCSTSIPGPPGDWGTFTSGTSPVSSRFSVQGAQLTVNAGGDYVIPGAPGTGAPAVADIVLYVPAIARTAEQFPPPGAGAAWSGVPPLPIQACWSSGVGLDTYYGYVAYSNQRLQCNDGTWVFNFTTYYDYQYPDEIHDEVSGSWSVVPKALDASYREIGDPVVQQVVNLNFQIPHN